jgi:8-oxoguanine deaminase
MIEKLLCGDGKRLMRGTVDAGTARIGHGGCAAGQWGIGMAGASSESLWIKDPLAVLAAGAERGIVIRGGIIAELVPRGAAAPAAADGAVFEAGRHVVLPGLINTHHHFYQTLTRALPPATDRELFGWLTTLYPVWARLTPDALDCAATTAMAALLLSGCTTTTDHHYVFPPGLEDAIDVEVAVARRLGIRAVLTRGAMNRSVKDGGLPPDSVVQDEDTILADSARLVARYHERGPDAMVQIALAPCSPFTVTTSLMKRTAELAERLDVRLHTHLAETEDETRYCAETYNCRPLDYVADCGWLSPRVWVAHGIHFTAAEMARLARAGVAIAHCPCSNQQLAAGHCPVCDLEAAGVQVGLGVDGSASNEKSNLIEEVYGAWLFQRGRYGAGRVSWRDALRWATQGSAACIGRPELGAIVPGNAADLALFDLDELRFAGYGDPLAALVHGAANRADRVMVGGRWVVEDGAIPGLDLALLIARQNEMARKVQSAA